MKFTKMHGCGNDYVYVDGGKENVPSEKKSKVAQMVSDRHFGIGSDGIIFINPVSDDDSDFEMEMYNADGSRSEMCGNGIRCVAKYVYDKKLTDKTTLTIVSAGKKKYIDLTIGSDGLVKTVKVDMGAPILDSASVPVSVSDELLSKDNKKYETLSKEYGRLTVDVPIEVAEKTWHMTCVSMGNPHCVVFTDGDVDHLDLEKIGPEFEFDKLFPERVNTEFVSVLNNNTLKMRVWERGSGETWACGTGACAVAVAACENGFCKKGEDIKVKLIGGELIINYTDDTVYMTGNAEKVFEGEVEL